MLSRGEAIWFVLQVIPRHEGKVAKILELRGYAHFLPTYRTRRKWTDRVKVIEQPLFPGYVFCERHASLMEVVHRTPGIIRLVSFGGKPGVVAEEEISALKRIIDSDRDVCSFPFLSTGQKVEVIAGPLMGVSGIITQFKNRDRLVLSVELIMKSISVEIDRSEVAPVHRAVA